MPKYIITYTDYTEDLPTVKIQTLNGRDHEDAEINLYRKTKCQSFEIVNIREILNYEN